MYNITTLRLILLTRRTISNLTLSLSNRIWVYENQVCCYRSGPAEGTKIWGGQCYRPRPGWAFGQSPTVLTLAKSEGPCTAPLAPRFSRPCRFLRGGGCKSSSIYKFVSNLREFLKIDGCNFGFHQNQGMQLDPLHFITAALRVLWIFVRRQSLWISELRN